MSHHQSYLVGMQLYGIALAPDLFLNLNIVAGLACQVLLGYN